MPTSLLDAATQERDLYKTARDNAQSRLTAAQTSLTAARKQLSDALAQLQSYEDQIAAARAKLAVTTVPSEATLLVAQITALLIQHRQQQAVVLDARSTQGNAQASVASAQSMVGEAAARLSAAEAKLQKVTQENTQRQNLTTKVGQAPLVDLRTTANNVLTGAGGSTLYADALAKFGTSVIPAKLWELAGQRYTLWADRLKRARQAVDTAQAKEATLLDANGGLVGKAEKQGIAFHLAERRLTDYALTAMDRYKRAVALLQKIAAPTNQVLTTAEIADVQADPGTRNPAADLEKALNTAQSALDGKQAAYDDAVLAAYAKDPNDTDVSDDTDVQTAQGELDTATTARNTARGNLGASQRKTLRDWAAVIPDSAWRQIFDFLEATALLTEVKDTPTSLVTDLTAAETAYADALIAAVKNFYSLVYLENAIATRKAMLETAQADQSTRLLSAIRGDGI